MQMLFFYQNSNFPFFCWRALGRTKLHRFCFLSSVRVTKANYAIVHTARGRISRTQNCECQILYDGRKKNFQLEIVANPEPIFPRDIVRKSRETNALTTAAATKTFTDTQEFIVAYLDFAFANALTRFTNGKGH